MTEDEILRRAREEARAVPTDAVRPGYDKEAVARVWEIIFSEGFCEDEPTTPPREGPEPDPGAGT